jgi:hypothetical protein
MISDQATEALAQLESGARFNTMHSVARELIEAGYASNDWGYLGLTEAGRIYLRRGARRIHINSDDQSCDLSVHQMQVPKAPIDRTPLPYWKNHAAVDRDGAVVDDDPMASPQHINKGLQAKLADLELPPEAPPEPLPIAESRMQEMMRAAGVASGITGIWVEDRWVEEFIRALDAP